LFITHRLSSITGADLIVVMGEGVVLEVGNHEQLLANRGPYFALYRQQGRTTSESPPEAEKVADVVAALPPSA
jgi:ATP-binding cassette subfamily B protein